VVTWTCSGGDNVDLVRVDVDGEEVVEVIVTLPLTPEDEQFTKTLDDKTDSHFLKISDLKILKLVI